jgi:DNA-binding IclR family transcriptional regulator
MLDKLVSEADGQSPGTERSSVASISKAIAILRLLGNSNAPLTMTEIARDTNLTPSSCHDLVTTLMHIGLVQPSAMGKSYEIGVRLVRLAKMALVSPNNFLDTQRAMNLISDKYDVNLSVFRAFGRLNYISTQVSEGSAPIRIRLSPGQEFPLFRGSPGKFFAAYHELDEDARKQALLQVGIDSPAKVHRFEAAVEEDKRRGCSIDLAEAQRGVASISVPILGASHKLVGVIELVMFRNRYDNAPVQAIVQDAMELAQMFAEERKR